MSDWGLLMGWLHSLSQEEMAARYGAKPSSVVRFESHELLAGNFLLGANGEGVTLLNAHAPPGDYRKELNRWRLLRGIAPERASPGVVWVDLDRLAEYGVRTDGLRLVDRAPGLTRVIPQPCRSTGCVEEHPHTHVREWRYPGELLLRERETGYAYLAGYDTRLPPWQAEPYVWCLGDAPGVETAEAAIRFVRPPRVTAETPRFGTWAFLPAPEVTVPRNPAKAPGVLRRKATLANGPAVFELLYHASDGESYARGYVTAPGCAPLRLPGRQWHRVLPFNVLSPGDVARRRSVR